MTNKLEKVRREIHTDHATLVKTHEEMRGAIVSDFNTIKSDVIKQRRQREEFYEKLINKLGGEIIKLNQALVEETKEREESHFDILSSLKTMRSKFLSINEVADLY